MTYEKVLGEFGPDAKQLRAAYRQFVSAGVEQKPASPFSQAFRVMLVGSEMQAAIRVFPAVPDQWPNAVFHNLRTAGAFLVSAVRKGGRTQWVRVQSLAGGPCRVKPNLPGPVRAAGKREFSLRDLGGGVYELDLRQGEEALLYCGGTIPQPMVAPSPAQEGKCNRYGLDK